MENDELLKCPLCKGLTHVQRSDLLALLSDEELREKLEVKVGESTPFVKGEQAALPSKPSDFGKRVHSWNPNLHLWNRSPKE